MNFGNCVTEIQQKYKREREKVGERKFRISVIIEIPAARTKEKKIVAIVAMSLSKMGRKKIVVVEIWGGIKKKSATFTIFLQQITDD